MSLSLKLHFGDEVELTPAFLRQRKGGQENIGPLGLMANSSVPVPALLMVGSQGNPDESPPYPWPRPALLSFFFFFFFQS